MKEIADRYCKASLEAFNKLPDRAKELFWAYKEKCLVVYDGTVVVSLDDFLLGMIEECESPIEIILNMALEIQRMLHPGFSKSSRKYMVDMEINHQQEVGKYRVDFMIYAFAFNHKKDGELPQIDITKELAIECDGHDFHEKTKEQVKKNNERDYFLKSNGIDILHFSGSEIYNDPIECANKVYDYIFGCIEKTLKERGIA